jgi:hypothetical protein
MGARQSTYRTRDLTQAIVGIRRAGLGICRVENEAPHARGPHRDAEFVEDQ